MPYVRTFDAAKKNLLCGLVVHLEAHLPQRLQLIEGLLRIGLLADIVREELQRPCPHLLRRCGSPDGGGLWC